MHRKEAHSKSTGSKSRGTGQSRNKELKNMLIKSTKKSMDLAPEGECTAELKQVAYKNENKKCLLNFETGPEGQKQLVPKEVPTSFDAGPLRKDLELLNGGEFTTKQVEDGIEPENFVGKRCRALVVHKRTSGGRVVAVVSVLLPLPDATATLIPAEEVQSPAPAQVAA